MTTHNPTYLAASIQGAIDDFRRDAGPSNVNEPLINLACDLLELAHADQGYTEADALDTARREASALGHAEQSIKDTLKSAQRRTAGKARTIPEPKHSPRQTRARPAPADQPRAPKIPPKSYTDLADYAAAHGAPLAAYTAAGWSDSVLYEHTYTNRNGEQQTALRNQGPGTPRAALRFVTEGGPRWRLIDGKDGPKYWHPKDAHTDEHKVWYLLDSARPLIDQTGYIVLVNGEASAVAAQHYGIPAICEAGGGEKTTPQHLLDQLINEFPPELTVLIPADCDARGRKAAPGKAEQYRKAGYTARAVDLNLAEHDDLANFCRLHQADSLAELLKCRELADSQSDSQTNSHPASESRGPRFIIRSESDLAQIEPPTWLLDNELQKGGYHLIYGASGSGKTFYALDRTLRAAALGARCLYIATEDLAGLRVRVAAWRYHHQDAGGRITWLEMPEGLDLSDQGQVHELLTTIGGIGYDLVTIDTLREAHTGDENSSMDMAAVNRAVQRLIRETGAGVDLVHHSGVNEGRERGSTALSANCDLKFKVTPDDDRVIVSCEKFRHGAALPPRYYRITPVAAIERGALILPASDTSPRANAPITAQQRKVLEALSLSIFSEIGAKTTQIADSTSIPTSSLFRILSTLKNRGWLDQGTKGDPYTITPAGRATIGPEYTTLSEDSAPVRATLTPLNQLSPTLNESDTTCSLDSLSLSPPVGVRVRESRERSMSGENELLDWIDFAGPPCSASSLDLVNRDHVLRELAKSEGEPERYLERIRDHATRRYVEAEIECLALASTVASDEADEPAEFPRSGPA